MLLVTCPTWRVAGKHGGSRLRNDIPFEREPHELACHASVASMQHANNHLLTDIAPFGQADGPRFDACLERDRILVHVAMKLRHARFDAERLDERRVELRGPRREERRLQGFPPGSLDKEVVSGLTGIGDARGDRRPASKFRANITVLAKRRQASRMRLR